MSRTVRSKARKASRVLTGRWRTTVAAKAIVRDPDGRILVIRRSGTDKRRPLTWDLPGGTVRYGEDPAGALAREVMEETGLLLTRVRPLRIGSRFGRDEKQHGRNHRVYVINLIFEADAYVLSSVEHARGLEPLLSSEHDRYRWLSPWEHTAIVHDTLADMPDRYSGLIRELLVADLDKAEPADCEQCGARRQVTVNREIVHARTGQPHCERRERREPGDERETPGYSGPVLASEAES